MVKACRRSYRTIICLLLVSLIQVIFTVVSKAEVITDVDYLEELVESFFYYDIPDKFYMTSDLVEKVKSLGDPYSQYYTAEEFQEFVQGIDMNFQGIGVFIEPVEEGILITSVIEGSGASEAGLLEGDIIIEADGKPLNGLSQEEAVSLIKGKEDTYIMLRLKRNGSYLTVSVKRGNIHIPTVQGKLIDNNVGYIIIHSFGEETNNEFYTAINELEKQNPTGYILDVQANPGGYLHSALDLIGYFAGGKTALSARNKYGETTVYAATDHKMLIDKPIVLLTNRFSASASEILAAAFKDYKAGIIVGEKTFGKGTVQNMFYLPNGDVVKLTVEQFFSPFGNPINKIGVAPDLLTAKVDPEKLAALLFGKANSSKREYMRFTFNGHTFDINLLEARKPENWEVYGQIINLFINNQADLKKGSFFRWQTIKKDDISKLWKFYYPEYKELPALTGVSPEKQFTITLQGEVPQSFLDNSPFELIHRKTGERIPIIFKEEENHALEKTSVYKVVPQKLLAKGETYYLVIHTGLASGSQHDGTIVEVTVAK